MCLNHKMISHFFCDVKFEEIFYCRICWKPFQDFFFSSKPDFLWSEIPTRKNSAPLSMLSEWLSYICISFHQLHMVFCTSLNLYITWSPCGTSIQFSAPLWICVSSSAVFRASIHVCTKNEKHFTPTIFLHKYDICFKI